jgi:hypothetical protein
MRHRTASLSWTAGSWTAGLAIALAATSFMASTPAEAARNCRSEKRVTYKRVCTRVNVRTHVLGRTWQSGDTGTPTGGVKCENKPITRTVLICQQSPAVPRAVKPGQAPIRRRIRRKRR